MKLFAAATLFGVTRAWPTGTKGFMYGHADGGQCDTVGSAMDKEDLNDNVFFGGHTKSLSLLYSVAHTKCADHEFAFIALMKYSTSTSPT